MGQALGRANNLTKSSRFAGVKKEEEKEESFEIYIPIDATVSFTPLRK